jgi:hypothetical protein
MADIPVKLYRTTTVREGTSPTNPSFPADQEPIIENPEGTSDFVPYVDANKNVQLGEFGLSTGFVKYDTTPTNIPEDQGTSYWDVDDETVAIVMNGITQKVGEDQFLPVKNMTGSTIPKGSAVGYAGTIGSSGRVLISLFLANGASPSKLFLGVTGESIPTGGDSKVYTFGRLKGINTSAFTANQVIYCSPSVAGGFTATVPTSPNNIISVAVVITSSATVGSIFIRPQLGSDINENEGVRIISPLDGQALVYDSALGLWVNGSGVSKWTDGSSFGIYRNSQVAIGGDLADATSALTVKSMVVAGSGSGGTFNKPLVFNLLGENGQWLFRVNDGINSQGFRWTTEIWSHILNVGNPTTNFAANGATFKGTGSSNSNPIFRILNVNEAISFEVGGASSFYSPGIDSIVGGDWSQVNRATRGFTVKGNTGSVTLSIFRVLPFDGNPALDIRGDKSILMPGVYAKTTDPLLRDSLWNDGGFLRISAG